MVTRHVLDAGVGDPAPERVGQGSISGGWLHGGWFEADLVPEGFEFVDEPTFPCFRAVDAAGEVVRAQVAVGGGLGQHMPDDHNEGVGGGRGGLLSAGVTETAVEATELGADVAAGAPGGPVRQPHFVILAGGEGVTRATAR